MTQHSSQKAELSSMAAASSHYMTEDGGLYIKTWFLPHRDKAGKFWKLRELHETECRRRKSIHCTRSGRIQDFSFSIKFAANINKQFEAICYLEYTCKNRSCQLYMCTMSHSVDVHANTACQEHITIEVAIRQSCHLNANFTHTHTFTHPHIRTFIVAFRRLN